MAGNKQELIMDEDFGQYIDVDGVNVHYYEEGYGTPVIFIHGIGQSMYTFRNNLKDFSACFRVIALDLLGHGSTDGNDSDLLIEDYSEFLLSFMNALNIDKAHFFAFSSGAIIAMDFALAFPERVKKLLLITPGGVGDAYPAVIRNAGKPVISDFEFTFFNRGMIAKTLESAYFDKTMITDELVDEYFSQLSDPKNLDTAMQTVAQWDDTDVMENMHALTDVYIFWGECDQWHPMEQLEAFEDAIENVYSATVRNGGHMIHEEKSREINRKGIELLLTDDVTG